MGASTLSLVLGGLGVLLLYRMLLRLGTRARVQDAVVVITGASSGLGKEKSRAFNADIVFKTIKKNAIVDWVEGGAKVEQHQQGACIAVHECARIFHAAGARLVLCGRDTGRLQEVAQELTQLTTSSSQGKTYTPSTVTFDLAKAETVDRAAGEILQCYGQVDILINNAGISYRGNILDTDLSVQRAVMDTNYFGPIALTQALLPSMVRRRSGHIVVISSIQGKIAIPYRSAYAASKHATQAYFDCLRAEVEHYGIGVTVVSPGYIQTNLSLNAVTGDGSKYGVLDKTTAMGRDPRDVAKAVLEAVRHRSKDIILAGPLPALAVYLRNLWPALFFKVMSLRARKEQRPQND